MSDIYELYHYGVKGMKWGVRKKSYESGGSVSESKKKRLSKQYKKLMVKSQHALGDNYEKLYVDAHNKMADYMNTKFKGSQKDYAKVAEKHFQKNLNKSIYDFTVSDKNYKKAKALAKKYSMTDWDALARENEKGEDDFRRQL